MTNVFIIHGSYGNPSENWFPWLKEELEKKGCSVFAPKLPTPKDQCLENWQNVFSKYDHYLTRDSIVVGHSLGVAFLLNILERIEHKIKAAFLVSGFCEQLNSSRFDKINKTFIKRFDYARIMSKCDRFFVYHSDNDPYVPLSIANNLAQNLGVKVILIKNAGHINKESGYTKFKELFDDITHIL